MPRRATYKKAFYLAVLVAASLALVKYTAFGRLSVSPAEAALRDVLSPVQGLATQVGHRIKGLVSFPFDVVGMNSRNQELSKRLKNVEGQLRQMEEYHQENERLKKQLNFKSDIARSMGLELKSAAVIGRDPGNWFGMITINKGSADGIRKDMTVLTAEGLVGRVTSVSSATAEVLLITDPRSGVGTLIQENRTPGLVEGIATASGQLQMVHIPVGAKVEKGQTVVTSGLGSLYQKGIPIGTVVSVGRENTGLFNSASVTPFVDFDRLEEVMLIVGAKSSETNISLDNIPPPWGTAKPDASSPDTIHAGDLPVNGKPEQSSHELPPVNGVSGNSGSGRQSIRIKEYSSSGSTLPASPAGNQTGKVSPSGSATSAPSGSATSAPSGTVVPPAAQTGPPVHNQSGPGTGG